MGFLRLLLALSVVLAHSAPVAGNKLVGGVIAVQSFYIISGFYMSLILNEKYIGVNNNYKLFLSNRFLRLFPVYWIVALATLILTFAAARYSSHAPLLSVSYSIPLRPLTLVSLIASNVLLFGQDLMMFLGVDPVTGTFHFFHSAPSGTIPGWHFMVIPQAWTIAVELMFYLVAPFILRRSVRLILLLMGISMIIRIALYYHGFQNDPWTYRFFPSELFFFLTGNICYRGYKKLQSSGSSPMVAPVLLIALLLFSISFEFLPGALVFRQWLYYLLVAVSIPFVFLFTRKNKFDNTVGELSYPVYISHVLVFSLLGYLHKFVPFGPDTIGLVTCLASIAAAYLLIVTVIKPVERIRQKRIKRI